MRRFAVFPRRCAAVPSAQFCFTATLSSPALRRAGAATTAAEENTTATSAHPPQLERKETPAKVSSVPLLHVLLSAAADLQRMPHTSSARVNAPAGERDSSRAETSAESNVRKEGNNASKLSEKLSPSQFIHALSTYLRREEQIELLSRSKIVAVRRQYVMLRARQPRLSSLQRELLLQEATRIVERREVPLRLSCRLLRPRWPNYFMDVVGSRHRGFLVQSIRVWIVSLLKEEKLTAEEARSVLVLCPHVFSNQVSLTGSVVECALSDLKTLDDPEPLIQLMWAVNSAGTHAPHHFWQRTVEKLAALNRSMRDQVGDAIRMDKTAEKKIKNNNNNNNNNNKERTEGAGYIVAGHVFSGLTTRQLFRVLRVLRKERWCGDVPTIFDFMDKALKNIVFEVEAAHTTVGDDGDKKKPRVWDISRRVLMSRVRKTADLTPAELLSLLEIAGELGVDFHLSMARMSEYLLAPMVQYLNREQFLLLTSCIRQTRCDSPHLVQTVVDTIVRRGVMYPCSLALTKAALRSILQKPGLLSELTLAPFVDHIFNLCDTYKWSMRASQILAWVELLYSLSRLYSPSSSVGVRVRVAVESLAEPLIAMLRAGVVPTSIVSRVLEHSLILGMRNQPQYPLTAKLWEERNIIVNGRNAKLGILQDTMEERDGDISMNVDDVEMKSNGEMPRPVRQVYEDMIAVYERHAVMRMQLSPNEEARISQSFQHAGLYSIFKGANIMKELHLWDTTPAAGNTKSQIPKTLPVWMERQVASIIDTRIRTANISPQSTDNDVLRVLGQRRCDAAKVHRFQKLVQDSPLLLARQQHSLWQYMLELARRFGGAEEKSLTERMLAQALY